jgi:hypothetical protein
MHIIFLSMLNTVLFFYTIRFRYLYFMFTYSVIRPSNNRPQDKLKNKLMSHLSILNSHAIPSSKSKHNRIWFGDDQVQTVYS